jgi:hypothetical protein
MMSRHKHYVILIGWAVLMAATSMARALPEDCLDLTAPAAFLETNGLVCLQKVIVADQGDTQLFKASLQWLGVDNPNQFKLLSAEFDHAASEADSPTFSAADGLLILPKVDIPKQFGTERYTVSLAWVPGADDSTVSLFELAKVATYINPDYIPNVTWKPYGMLHPEERRAVDILGRSIPYAQLADAIYDFDNIAVDTWELIESISKSSGMQAGVYNNRDTGELTLAFRGTEACSFPCSLSETKAYLLDVAADTALTLGFVNDQFKHAFNFAQDVVNRYPGRKITVTGHSLGGGLAQAVGAVLGLETFAFNSSPVPDDFFDSYPLSLTSEQLEEIIYVIADIHDPVSNTDETGKFYLNADHVTPLIQFNFDLKEISPDQSFGFDDLRFDRHSITKLFNNATSLISTFREGW